VAGMLLTFVLPEPARRSLEEVSGPIGLVPPLTGEDAGEDAGEVDVGRSDLAVARSAADGTVAQRTTTSGAA